ncbi:MAG: hypothetical protein AB1342_02005 [Pseudomonadota bacterium]
MGSRGIPCIGCATAVGTLAAINAIAKIVSQIFFIVISRQGANELVSEWLIVSRFGTFDEQVQ